MIHQNVPHQLRGNAKKVSTVLPVRRLLMEEAQICLVNQGSTLKGVIGAFLPEVAAGDAAQLSINQGDQLFPSVWVAAPPVEEQLTNLFGRSWAPFRAPIKASQKSSGDHTTRGAESTDISQIANSRARPSRQDKKTKIREPNSRSFSLYVVKA